jgi:hypothetical protein
MAADGAGMGQPDLATGKDWFGMKVPPGPLKPVTGGREKCQAMGAGRVPLRIVLDNAMAIQA